MRAAYILFTDKGERVPFFADRGLSKGDPPIGRHGWKTVRKWQPGFFVVRQGGNYRVGAIVRNSGEPIEGSVYQLRAWDWRAPAITEKCFPRIAAVEVYLRTIYGQS